MLIQAFRLGQFVMVALSDEGVLRLKMAIPVVLRKAFRMKMQMKLSTSPVVIYDKTIFSSKRHMHRIFISMLLVDI